MAKRELTNKHIHRKQMRTNHGKYLIKTNGQSKTNPTLMKENQIDLGTLLNSSIVWNIYFIRMGYVGFASSVDFLNFCYDLRVMAFNFYRKKIRLLFLLSPDNILIYALKYTMAIRILDKCAESNK